jgi:hypothetical protein
MAPQKDVSDIKNFCFLHHTSPKSSLEYGPNWFLAKNEPKKLTPLFRKKMAKIGQNRPKCPQKGVNDIENLCFLHHTTPKSYEEHGPNQKQQKKIDPAL